MDLSFRVTENKYYNIKDVLRNEFNISTRLLFKLKKSKKIYLNRM